jgi:hypothetical protein
MSVPKQVSAAAEAADKLHAEIYIQEDLKPDEDPKPDEDLKPDEDPKSKEDSKPDEDPKPDLKPVGPNETIANLSEQLRKSEARYNSLRGKYEAEVPRLLSEVESLKKQILAKPKDMDNNEINKANPPEDKRLITSAEVEEYGEEFLDVVKRTAKEEMSSTMTHLANENQHLRNRIESLDEESQSNKEEAFYAYLDKNVDNWREINQDESFVEWLDAVDELSGSTRKDLIGQAYSQLNAPRVASFFSMYGKTIATEPNSTESENPTLTEFAAPSTAPNPAQDTGGKMVVYSEGEIKKFYDDSRKGLYTHRQEEYARIEADINAAIKEGRVLPNSEIKRRMSM